MIAAKNIVILLLIETTVFYGGFYFNDVLASMQPIENPSQCEIKSVDISEPVAKKKRIRWGGSKITGNSKDGWGFK